MDQSARYQDSTNGGGRGWLFWLLAAVLVVGGLEIFTQVSWDTGVAAYNRGYCQDTITHLGRLTDLGNVSLLDYINKRDRRAEAADLKEQCELFEEGNTFRTNGEYARALGRYLDFAREYPRVGLVRRVPENVGMLLSQSDLQTLADGDNCARLKSWPETATMFPNSDRFMPEFYYYCGETFVAEREYEAAMFFYDLAREAEPNSQLYESATAGLVNAEMAFAAEIDAPRIEQPLASGVSSPGTSTYIVQNASPHALQIMMRGPQLMIEEIPPCETCTTYSDGLNECPEEGPEEVLTLFPGDYDVLVRALDDEYVTPFRGSWAFSEATEYAECYYVELR